MWKLETLQQSSLRTYFYRKCKNKANIERQYAKKKKKNSKYIQTERNVSQN